MRRLAAPVLVSLLALAGCGGATSSVTASGSSGASDTAIPAVTDMAGEVVVSDLDAIRYVGRGSTCVTLAPYRSIGRGTRVVVRSDTGAVKAITTLYGGRLRRAGTEPRPAGCVFGFDYAGAAAGRPTYFVKVAGVPALEVPFSGLTRIEVVVPAR